MQDKVITFDRSPFAIEIFTKENEIKFDKLPDWIRKFISALINHGNLHLAAQEAKVASHSRDFQVDPQTIVQSLYTFGIDGREIAHHLKECLNAKSVRGDGRGNQIEQPEYRIKLETIRLLYKILEVDSSGGDSKNSEAKKEEFLELFGE